MGKKVWLLVGCAMTVLVAAGLAGCATEGGAATASDGVQTINIGGQQEGIWVTGTGRVSAVPDVATLRLGIEAQDTSVTSAQAQAADAMDSVMSALTDNGVASKDIQTQYFSIYRATRWDSERQEEVTIGYRVSNMVSAKLRNMDRVGPIIDAAVRAGGDLTRINGIDFSVDDPSPYFEQAREEAMAEAKAMAQQMATLAGVRLGRPVYISVSGYQPPVPVYAPSVKVEAGIAAETPISPGETEISVSVQVTYSILD